MPASGGTGGTAEAPSAGMPAPSSSNAGAAGSFVNAPLQHSPGECGLHTRWAGDELCILPPTPDKGFQIHIGPSSYDNPEAKYLLAAGEEATTDNLAVSGNDKDVYVYAREFRMRPGGHHYTIVTDIGDSLGQRIGTADVPLTAYPKDGVIAPENQGVGLLVHARAKIDVSLHAINVSDKEELREVWVNFFYRPASEVAEPINQLFVIAPQDSIAPATEVTTKGSCTVDKDGRMLWAFGRRYANTLSFSVWRSRGSQKDLVYQGYDWADVLTLEYSSTVTNPMPSAQQEGGWSGILDMRAGDKFLFECHVVNTSSATLNFTNNLYTGEMCILNAETVGASCN